MAIVSFGLVTILLQPGVGEPYFANPTAQNSAQNSATERTPQAPRS